MERKGMEWARGRSVILLKVSDFNQVIFICLFVVRVHSFGLQRQVRMKRCSGRISECGKQLVVAELNLFQSFTFIQPFNSTTVYLRSRPSDWWVCWFTLNTLKHSHSTPTLNLCIVSAVTSCAIVDTVCDCSHALVLFSDERQSGLWVNDNYASHLGLTYAF